MLHGFTGSKENWYPVAARRPELVSHVGMLAAAGVRFRDNPFGKDVLAGQNPFGVADAHTLQRYLDILFRSRQAQPWIPWPVSEIVIARRRHDARFEQSVLDRIGRSDERFAPGAAARDVRQPALLLWCRQDRVIDPSAMDLYAAAMPQARKMLLQGCGHMSLMEQPENVADAIDELIGEVHDL
jgi:pimeloyl-ACP methyl ester carboxylesterase